MSISTNYPSVRPSLLLDFANTKTLDPRITFTRGSTATYYDGKTVAKAEENLALYSQEFDNAVWANSQTTETSNSTTAPDGTSTADTLDDGVLNTAHDVSQSANVIVGTTYTLSAFFKNIDRQYVILAFSTGANTWIGAKFNLVAGTVGSTSAAGAGYSVTSSSITSVGNSWYRCSVTFVSGQTGTGSIRLGMATDSTTFTASQRGLEVYTGSNKTIYIWGAQFEQRSSLTAYTPTTTQAITNYIPVLLTAASGVARFEHNPITGESLGLEIEEQRTNLILRSEEFDNAAWGKTASTISANTTVAPNGILSGNKLIESASTSLHQIFQIPATSTSDTFTFTCYAKKAERAIVELRISDIGYSTGSRVYATFDLNSGTLGTIGFISSTNTNYSITGVGNEWYRLTVSATLSVVTGTTTYAYISSRTVTASSSSGESYTGDGYSGVYIWGAQLEAGAFPTSYIPTVASQVTRAADSASMTGTNFSSWYRADEGALYADYQVPAVAPASAAQIICMVSDATFSNVIQLLKRANADVSTRLVISTSAVNQVFSNLGTFTTNPNKIAASYKINDFAGVLNAASVLTTTTGTVPSGINQLSIGSSAGSSSLNGTVKRIAYYPARLSNTQLQALTTV